MPEPPRPKVRIVTLGCAKNDVDSEEIAGVLAGAGYELTADADADLMVINTCGFIEASKRESLQAIREAVRAKKEGRTGKVVVAGCLSQRMGSRLAEAVPGADAYVGVGQMARFDEIARETLNGRGPRLDITPPHHRWAGVPTRARSGTPWSAYLKVSEGCDHRCTFCTIPSFRGPHRSKPMERVLDEARFLAKTGAKELNLIAQDVTQYGYDIYREFTLPRLLRELSAVDGVEWIRLLYFYPSRMTDEVIEALASVPKVLPYVDMPLQHAHPDALRRMKRPWDGDRYLQLFERLRSAVPGITIRSTFIVGFPGETKEEFEYLLTFLERAKLDRVGAFVFSREKGTPSYDMPAQVPFRIKRERYDELMVLQQHISLGINEAMIGRKLDVLVEGEQGGWLVGRSVRDAPEIDGLVYSAGQAKPGSIIQARITAAEPYDLFGVMDGAPARAPRLKPLPMAARKSPK